MADQIEMNSVVAAARVKGADAGILEQLAKVASSFGFNLPERAKEKDSLALQIAEAKDVATAARWVNL